MLLKTNKQVPLEVVLNIVQKELCLTCPVYEYTNRDCSKCPNNLEERLKDEGCRNQIYQLSHTIVEKDKEILRLRHNISQLQKKLNEAVK